VATHEVGIPDLVQAMFYAMTVAYAKKLCLLPAVVEAVIEEVLGDLQWF